jgi:hypothetical protein
MSKETNIDKSNINDNNFQGEFNDFKTSNSNRIIKNQKFGNFYYDSKYDFSI